MTQRPASPISAYRQGAMTRLAHVLRYWGLRLVRPAHLRSAYGVVLGARWGDSLFADAMLGRYGHYLSDYLRAPREDFAYLDIGAGLGLHAIIAAENPACRRVLALEPDPGRAEAIAANIALNGIHGIEFEPRGVATGPGALDAAGLDALVPAKGEPLIVRIGVVGAVAEVLSTLAACRFLPRVQAIHYPVDAARADPDALAHLLAAKGFHQARRIGRVGHYDVLAERHAGVRPHASGPAELAAAHRQDPHIRLSGHIDVPEADRAAVAAALTEHIRLSRAEPGCLSFDVTPDPDVPGRYRVAESFASLEAFNAHQTRTHASEWWQVTRGCTRSFEVEQG